MAAPVVQSSFSAGELSPHLFGRVDLSKYKIGVARMHNFLVDYRGGAAKRPGTRYVGNAKYATGEIIFIPFTFNVDQTYCLEFGHGYMRVITKGGYVLNASNAIYEIATPYIGADLKMLKWTQSGDTVTIVHQKYWTVELKRFNHADWRLTYFSVAPSIGSVQSIALSAHSSGYIDPAAAVYVNYGYGVTAVGDDGSESLMGPIARAFNVLDMSAHRVNIVVWWGQWVAAQYYNVYKATTGVNAQLPEGTRMGFVGSTRALSFNDSNILPNYTRSPPVYTNPFAPGQIDRVAISFGGSGYTFDPTITITDPTGSGAIIKPVVVHGSVTAAIVHSGGHSYTAPVVTIGGSNDGSVATGVASIGPKTGTYPGAVAYFQQRLLFAGSANNPSTLWGSKPGAFHNFDVGIPITDGDAFEFTIASQQLNAIKYMLPMPGGLVVLTAGGAWQLSGTQQFAPVTPTAVMATPQAFNGCGDLPPITIGYEILFIQTGGSVVRNLSYNFFANIYTGADLTVLSSHLFSDHRIVSWAYAEEPDKVIWAVRDDGMLLSLTFLKEQEVAGWAEHSTNGFVKAITCVREGYRDVVYIAVERVNSAGTRFTMIEQFQARSTRVIEDSWFLDCALSTIPVLGNSTLYSGPLSTTVILHTSSPQFAVSWIGADIKAGGGKFRITAVQSSSVITCDVLIKPTDTYLKEETGVVYMRPQAAGSWKASNRYWTVTGLAHLEGEWVSVVGDGKLQTDKRVVGGAITLDSSAAHVIVGLGYNAELQTLRLESQPTIQTRRKKIPALTVRVADTRGLWAGMTFKTLTEIKELAPSVLSGDTPELYTGDLRIVMDPLWEAEGQVCIRSVNGLPANIVAVIPEAVLGDD